MATRTKKSSTKNSPSAAVFADQLEPEEGTEETSSPGTEPKTAAKTRKKAAKVKPEAQAAESAIVPEAMPIEPETGENLKLAKLDVVSFGELSFEYLTKPNGTCLPRLKIKGETYFSGWLCKDRDAAESLVIPIYYQVTGSLKGELVSINPDLLATHPLSELIYPENNMGIVGESFDERGNRTQIFRVVVNPDGLALSGNTRLKILKEIQRKTGEAQIVHCVTTNGDDDISVILGGNAQREKTSQERMNEAMVKASSMTTGTYWTNVRKLFKELGGSGGAYDATKVLMDFVEKRRGTPFVKAVNQIGKYSPTVALELIKLHRAGEDDEGKPLPLSQRLARMGTELNLLARQKNAEPIRVDLMYDGISEQVAEIKQHYNGETTVEIARQLMLATPEVRLRMIEEAAKGVKIKMSLLREQLTVELQQPPDWNTLNDREEEATNSSASGAWASSPASSPASSGSTTTATRSSAPSASASAPASAPDDASTSRKGYQLKLGQMGIFPDSCWVLNEETAAALNQAIGGTADVDPFAEPEGNIKCDRRLLATERPTDKSYDWGGGVHDSGKGLRIATALPPRHGLVECADALFSRIENGTIAEACFVADASLLSISKFADHLKATPYAWVNVSRENKHSAAGFGFEPSEYVLARFKTQTADNWNDRCCDYVICYYGEEYARFEQACSKFGVVSYNAKAATRKSVDFDWTKETENEWFAIAEGVEYSIKFVGSTYFLYIDGEKTDDRFKKLEKAQRAAVLESLLITK